MTNKRIFSPTMLLAHSGVLALAMTGCSVGLAPTVQNPGTARAMPNIAGMVHGGQQPVSGSTVQLYAVGINGLKSSATPLIGSTVVSDDSGTFNITGLWNCTSNTASYGNDPELYIVATGGNPGLSGTVNNGALAMMAALGPCSSLTASSFIVINEVTTVASVIALTPFMADLSHVGAQGAPAVGLVNAFTTANTLANMATGTSPGSSLPLNASLPVSEIYTLADILASCVSSDGMTTPCAALFLAATPTSGSAPENTIAAMLNINANPANHVSSLMNLIQPSAPFQPALMVSPSDWTVALNFTGGGLSSPTGIALDANGNAWIANAGGNSITAVSSTGTLLTGATGFTANNTIFGAQGVAVDNNGNVWIADTLLDSIVKLTVVGDLVQSSTTFTDGGVSGPTSLAVDSHNNIWISNFAGGSVTELNSSGAAMGSSPLTANATLEAPIGIAVDHSGNAWVTDNGASIVAVFKNDQTLLSGIGYSDNAMVAPEGIAIDAGGRAWVADNGINATSLLNANGTSLLTASFVGGGLSLPAAVATDGQGNAWVANSTGLGTISELATTSSVPLSPASGLAVLSYPSAIAIDASGSIWTANAGNDSISRIIGVAVPIPTPLAATNGP